MNELKNKLIFDKKKPDKNNKHIKVHPNAFDSMHGLIILSADKAGVSAAPESSIDYLLLDDVLLEKTGWSKHKDNLIADGTITQADIDNEKLTPDAQARVQALEDIINKATV